MSTSQVRDGKAVFGGPDSSRCGTLVFQRWDESLICVYLAVILCMGVILLSVSGWLMNGWLIEITNEVGLPVLKSKANYRRPKSPSH